MSNDATTVAQLQSVARQLRGIGLTFNLPEVSEARGVRDELANQIDDYLVPRLQRLDAPLLAVMGGSTGSGKSTITNSIAGADVSPSGVLRPTTRAPVLICHPDDVSWFSAEDLLPDLPRVTGDGTATGITLKIQPVETLTPGLAIIDAPDIDSVEEANRELATQLLAAADLWVFVTTAVRYADAVPWEFLGRARSRGTSLAVVINRVPVGAETEIVPHLQAMLTEGGLPDVRLFAIHQTDLVDGRLPDQSVAELQGMLQGLAANAEQRAEVVRRTINGALESIPERGAAVAAASSAQDGATEELRATMERIFNEAKNLLEADLSGGSMLRGEVLDRWQELIGTNEMMRAIQSRITSVRDRISGFIRGQASATSSVQGEITSALEQLLIDHADAASLKVVTTWQQLPGGADVVGDDRSLERSSEDLRRNVGQEVRAWQDDILDLVRDRGSSKRNMARAMAFGVNGVGVALMIVLFAQTGGITGGEVAVASGTATVSQTLLNAIFGEQAVRELADEARKQLLVRINTLLDLDANRFRTALWSTVSPPEATAALSQSLLELKDSR